MSSSPEGPVQPLSMNEDVTYKLYQEAIDLLKQLIAIPSFSREEDETASLINNFLSTKIKNVYRIKNNIWAQHDNYDQNKPSILLNSHHDTVHPNRHYTIDPLSPVEKNGRLFGLGSNDAGGSLVALIATFLYFNNTPLKYNLIVAATAEEEISGREGLELILPELNNIDFAIVGEPTQMQMAVAERGLLVLDCSIHGKAGHAAREEGENAIYKALKDIEWFRTFQFTKKSDLLGKVKMTVTSINTENKAHNVIPNECNYIVDARINELYTFAEVLEIIKKNVASEIKPRSIRLKSTSIASDHPLVKSGMALGRKCFGSPTTSDKALMPFPALKMGPGDSARSHTADEFIYLDEIREGIELYIKLLEPLLT